MARPFPVAVRVDARPTETLESRLLALARPLKGMSSAEARQHFVLPAGSVLLKTTLSVCPDCLEHVPAAVFVEEGRVLMAKRCAVHGMSRAVVENDERYYRLSNKDRWGRAYDLARMTHVPAYEAGCCSEGESCGTAPAGDALADLAVLTDQRANKSCTVLVEVTDACNLACRVCYADAKGDRILSLEQFKRVVGELVALKNGLDSVQVTGGEAALHPQFWEMLD